MSEIRKDTIEELRNTSEAANSLLKSNILVISALVAGLTFLYEANGISLNFLSSPWFAAGIGCLFGSIVLSMQTQIYRWTEKATIIPVQLYKQSEDRARELSASQLQKSVRNARGVLYPGYMLLFLGLVLIAIPIINKEGIKDLFRVAFVVPIVVTFFILIYVQRKSKHKYPF